jgi:hypothetical protein
MTGMIFITVWVVIVAFIIYGIFTRKGRNIGINTAYGGNVVKDLGEIADYQIFAGRQKVRLLQCRDKRSEFYVLEADTTMPVSKQLYWIRIDKEALDKLNSLIHK